MKQMVRNISFGVVVGLMALSSMQVSAIPGQITVNLKNVAVSDAMTLHWMASDGIRSSAPVAYGMQINDVLTVPSIFTDTTGNVQPTAGFCIKVNGEYRAGHMFGSTNFHSKTGYDFTGHAIKQTWYEEDMSFRKLDSIKLR